MLKTGALLVFTTGEYSDKCVHGPFRVLRDFNLNDACEAWCGQRAPINLHDLGEDSPDGEFFLADEYTFIAWLADNDYLVDVEARSIHLGSYSRLEGDWTHD